jgi:FKBP-type peptidyl-prolyl cis-trans isomerase
MKNLKCLIITASLLLTLFASVADSQTRRGAAASRRARRARGAKVKPKNSVPRSVFVDATTASGLTYIITQHGEGRPLKVGDTVLVNYTGLLTDGTKFDSSLDRNEPIAFPLGAGRVIKGWDEGIARLHIGDRATLIIPPELGYGAKGSGGVIPPNATLIFIVEVVGVKETSAAGGDNR